MDINTAATDGAAEYPEMEATEMVRLSVKEPDTMVVVHHHFGMALNERANLTPLLVIDTLDFPSFTPEHMKLFEDKARDPDAPTEVEITPTTYPLKKYRLVLTYHALTELFSEIAHSMFCEELYDQIGETITRHFCEKKDDDE